MTLEMARPTVDYGNLPPHVRAQLRARDEAQYGPSKGKGWKAQALAQNYVNNINSQSYPQKGGGQYAGQSTFTSPSQPAPTPPGGQSYPQKGGGQFAGQSTFTSPSQPAPAPPGGSGFVPKGGGTNAGESTFTSPSQPAPAPPQISTGGVPQNQPYVGQKSFGNFSTKSVPGSKPGGSGNMPQGWQKNPDGGYIDHEGYKRSHLPSNIDKYNQRHFGSQTPQKGGGTNAGESTFTSPSQPAPTPPGGSGFVPKGGGQYAGQSTFTSPSQPEPVEDTQPAYEPSRPEPVTTYEPSRPESESVFTSPSQPAPTPPGGSGFVPKGGGQNAGQSTFTSPSQPAPTPPGVTAQPTPVSEVQGSSGVSYEGAVYGGQKSYGNMITKSVPSGGGGGGSSTAASGTQASLGIGTKPAPASAPQAATGSQGASGGTNLAAQSQAQKNDPYGMFNFNQLMNSFYSWQPGSNDAAGNAVKNTFAANMIQSGFDTQNALHLAYANQEIASQSMNQAADLEARNQALLMRDQFTYGMSKMGAEYDFQSRFAVDEANRQLLFQSHIGDIKQNQTKLEGDIQTGLINTQGTQDRLNINAQGKVDLDKIGLQGQMDVNNINAQGKVDLSKITTQGEQDRLNITAQGDQDVRKIGAQGDQDRLNIDAQGKVDLSKITRQGEVDKDLIGAQGEVDIEKIGAQGVVDQANITTQGKVDIDKIARQSDADVRAIGAQGDQDVRKIGAQGKVDKTNITTQGDVDVTKIGAQGAEDRGSIKTQGTVDVTKIGAQGAEDRKNIQTQSTEDQKKMREANRLEAKTRAEQSSYARGLAGMF